MSAEHFLLSAATLQEFVAHMESCALGFDRGDLIDIWRAADKSMARTREKEAGCADLAPVLPLPPSMAAQATALQKSAQINRAHSLVPVTFGLVEIDAMMVCKPVLEQSKLDTLQTQITAAPEDPELADICLSLPDPNVAAGTALVSRWDGERLLVTSEHADLRLLQVTHSAQPTGDFAAAPGLACAALQLTVGSTLPVMHVLSYQGRVLLVKGHHRARVLRAHGVPYVPCLVSVCTSIDDIVAAAPSVNAQTAQRCFDSERPPMLRDFDRAAWLHTYQARARRRLLQVRVEVTSQWLP
jgi:hypothetical protein